MEQKKLLLMYIGLCFGVWASGESTVYGQTNADTVNGQVKIHQTALSKSDGEPAGSPVIASYYKNTKTDKGKDKERNGKITQNKEELSDKQKATKELNEHSWTEEAQKHPYPYATVEGTPVSADELAKWWAVFDDPVLNQLIELTLENNRQLEAARSRVRQGRLQLGIAESRRLPWLDMSGSWTTSRVNGSWDSDREEIRRLPLESDMIRTTNVGKLGIDATWELDIFGRQKANVRAASNSLQATQADLYAAWVTLSAETALQYISLRTLQEQLRIEEEEVSRQEEAMDLLKANYEAGLISYLPIEQSTYVLQQTRGDIPNLKKQIAVTMSSISVLTGTVPGELNGLLTENSSLPNVDPHLFIGIPADALRQRPDIQAAERRLAAQQQKTKSAKADLKPRLALNGSIGLESFSSGGLISAIGRMIGIGPSLTMPIFHAGSIRKNIRVQSEKEREYLANYEETVLKVVGEVRNAVTDASQDYIKSQDLKAGVEAAEQAESLAHINFDSGLQDYTAVLDAKRNVLSLKNQYTMSRGQEFADVIRLFKALGGGWEAMDASQAKEAEEAKAGNKK